MTPKGSGFVAVGGAVRRRSRLTRNPRIAASEPTSPQRGEGLGVSSAYTQLLLHIVFSTKHRRPWIPSDSAERLYSYMGGIVWAEKGALLAMGGVADHVHMYLRWRADVSLSDLMRVLKSRSSSWVHETLPALKGFAWQAGYSAFSVSKSQESAVKRYIAEQAEHHRKEDFKFELLKLLRAHGVQFDERYLMD